MKAFFSFVTICIVFIGTTAWSKPMLRRSPLDLPTYICRKTSASIKVDGILNEPVWKKAEAVTFFLWNGTGYASQDTTARLCWDAKNLYVAFKCIDADVWGSFTRRDEPICGEEAVEIFLNPSCDLINYYEIEVSPLNVIYDLFIPNLKGTGVGSIPGANPKWNASGMQTAVHVDGTVNKQDDVDREWTVEISIPFEIIKGSANCPPKHGDRWRINLYRVDLYPEKEFAAWSPTLGNIPDFHRPHRFGALVFIDMRQ